MKRLLGYVETIQFILGVTDNFKYSTDQAWDEIVNAHAFIMHSFSIK